MPEAVQGPERKWAGTFILAAGGEKSRLTPTRSVSEGYSLDITGPLTSLAHASGWYPSVDLTVATEHPTLTALCFAKTVPVTIR